MDKLPFADSYEVEPIIVAGAAAVSGLIFSWAFLLFLSSQVSSHHPPFQTDTIGEMVGYAGFFFFAVASYFGVSVLVWRWGQRMARFAPSWLPISFLGSVFFSYSLFLSAWVSAVMTYEQNDPFASPPGSISDLLWFASIVGLGLSVITGTFAATGFEIYTRLKTKNRRGEGE